MRMELQYAGLFTQKDPYFFRIASVRVKMSLKAAMLSRL